MRFFPLLKDGDRINRKWLNSLISFVNSLYVIGDGNTTTVSHYENSTVVHAKGGVAQQGGGGSGASSGWTIDVSGGTATIPALELVCIDEQNNRTDLLSIPGASFAFDTNSQNSIHLLTDFSRHVYVVGGYTTRYRARECGIFDIPLAICRYKTFTQFEFSRVLTRRHGESFRRGTVRSGLANGMNCSILDGDVISSIYFSQNLFDIDTKLDWNCTGNLSYSQGEAISAMYGWRSQTITKSSTGEGTTTNLMDRINEGQITVRHV